MPWISLGILGFTLSSPAHATLNPGAEPCDKAVRHASAVIMESKKSLIARAESSHSELRQLEMILVKATDGYLHCESPNTSPEELEINIAHLFQVQRANHAPQGREGQSASPLEVSVGVSAQPDHPLRRLVDFEIREGLAVSRIAITYAPNPATISIFSANDGRLIPTNEPNGLARISDPMITRSLPAN